MPPVSWLQIRKLNGSQWDGFEECCCQLAHAETAPTGSQFVSKGKPDSGIECFWKLPTGEEWGWQAKFFPDGVDKSRLKQCDESVKKALQGHPNLTKLFFCIPCKLSDERTPRRVSAAQRWENHRQKWKNWATGRSRPIEFILWDEHELLLRLSRPENQGRWWFWFNAPLMDADWFNRNVTASIKLANERYSRDLHFDLPIARFFEALCHTPAFLADLEHQGNKLNEAVIKIGRHSNPNDLGDVGMRLLRFDGHGKRGTNVCELNCQNEV